MHINSYALFGENRGNWAFNVALNFRQHVTLYPDWEMWIHTDSDDDRGYFPVLNRLAKEGLLKLNVVNYNGLQYQERWKTMMMLWRMLPIWENSEYVFCRDLDSILTPRQLQCVKDFIRSGKIVHGINDNDAHCIPLMGGMCGFKSQDFLNRIGRVSINSLVSGRYTPGQWQSHGTDQSFLNEHILPIFGDSVFIHRLSGPNRRSSIKHVCDVNISYVNQTILERGDDFANYIGAAGLCNSPNFSTRDVANFYNEYGNKEKCAIISRFEEEQDINI
jgi:hypothetical protein